MLPSPPLASLTGPPLAAVAPVTLVEALHRLAERPGPWLHVGPGNAQRVYTGAEVLDLARRWRTALTEAGVRRGDRVALLLPNDERFVGAFFGAHLAGAAAVPLSWPVSLLDAGRKIEALRPLFGVADVRAVVTDPAFDKAMLGEVAQAAVVTEPAGVATGADVAPDPEETALLQFTSGSTSLPRGAEITHRALSTCVRSMCQQNEFTDGDVGVSWLPLFHDMGLAGGLLCPVVFGFPFHLMTPGEFLLHPGRWIQRFADVRGTCAAAPDFAWRLAARRVLNFKGDLSAWRIGLDGAEPVHRSTMDAFFARFGPHGLAETVLKPAYGLAENTLAVAIYDPRRPAPDVTTSLRSVPSVGGPLPGVSVRVLRDGVVGPEGHEGPIQVRSGSLMRGYFRNEAASSAALTDGWLNTGDLGVVQGGQLYVTGRAKEMLIQNGTKFHPYDLERVATDSVAAAMAGAAAFSTPGADGERLVIAVEVPAAFSGDVTRTVRGAIMEDLGVRVDVVLALAPGELPRTTSGKVRRGDAAAQLVGRVDG